MSDLSTEIEAFRKMISRLVEQLNEISSSSKTIPGTPVEQLSRKFSGLAEKLQGADKQLSQTNTKLDEIRNKWSRR
jgi:outer membrane murein-binding lipoprotein Lpp